MGYNDEAGLVLLCSLVDDVQAGIAIAALKEQGIPVMEKLRPGPSLSVIIGYTYQNNEIYVPSRFIDEAREIISVVMGADPNAPREFKQDESMDFNMDDATDEPGYIKYGLPANKILRVIFYLLLVICLGVPLIIGLIYILATT